MPNEIPQAYRHLELQNQLWLNQRVAWIVREFGREHIERVECVLPTAGRLAEYRGGTDAEVIEYFQRITCDLGLDPESITFSIEDHLETDDGKMALGLYSEPEEGKFSIAMAAEQLSDPCEMAATLVHELCHVHLLGHRRIDSQTEDHEPLTDLLCVFMGYGIIAANSVIHDRTDGLGAYSVRHTARSGYMTMSMFGYALALFAALRNEDGLPWRRHMRADVRDAFDHSLRFFQRTGLPNLSHVPEEFVEPLLTLESAIQPPPKAALSSLYAYSVDPEIHEDETDYPADQAEVTHAMDDQERVVDSPSAELSGEAECVYCGSIDKVSLMVLPALGESPVCGPCRGSIEEGEREAAELAKYEGQGSKLAGIVILSGFAFVALFILWALVSVLRRD